MIERCANCEAAIGNLETPYLWQGNVVCPSCYKKLNRQAAGSSASVETQTPAVTTAVLDYATVSKTTVAAPPPTSSLPTSAEEHILWTGGPVMFADNPLQFIVCIITAPLLIGLIGLWVWWLQCKNMRRCPARS